METSTVSMEDGLLEPVASYKAIKEAFLANCEAKFHELLARSGVNEAENDVLVRDYDEAQALAVKAEKEVTKTRTLRDLFIVFAVLGGICVFVGIVLLCVGCFIEGAIVLSVGAAVCVASACVAHFCFGKKLPAMQAELDQHVAEARERKEAALRQTAPLCALFEDGFTREIVEKTLPSLHLDKNVSPSRLAALQEDFGYSDEEGDEVSCTDALSGMVSGSPFLFKRTFSHHLGTCTYYGSITISWETVETDSEGNSYTVTHYETLQADVTRPKPYYHTNTRLVFANLAAPDLHFSRQPTHAETWSEKRLRSEVKAGVKRLQKRQESAISGGHGAFTGMANEEFEVLFGAENRDNEVQFRLLFTPLAQKNLLALIKGENGFSDDFVWEKEGMLNFLSSDAISRWDMDTRGEKFVSHSVKVLRRTFYAFNLQYFTSLYASLAPMLCVPIYQQTPAPEREEGVYPRNLSEEETECAVNCMQEAFRPQGTQTEILLKTEFLRTEGTCDLVRVTAYSYETVERTEYIPVSGGDGYTHDVPVDWIEYIPHQAEKTVLLREIGLSDAAFATRKRDEWANALQRYPAHAYFHGILCCIASESDIAAFSDAFTIEKK